VAQGLTEADLGGETKRVSPLELFFDLVFVFAITQVTALMAHDPTWGGLLRGMLALTAVWWAWAAYAWLTNEVDPEDGAVRAATIAAMVAMLLASLALPEAFGEHALLFALAYLALRVLHIGLFVVGTEDVGVRAAARTLAPAALAAPAVLVIASFLDRGPQEAVWIVVVVLDLFTGGVRGIGGFRLSPGHFVERHGLIVIIALGESIVAIGVGAEASGLGTPELVAAGLGVVVAAALWWAYFDDLVVVAEERLEAEPPGLERNRLARDSYSYLHLVMVAGIVLLALGVKKTLEHVDEPLKAMPGAALAGGVAVYLLGQAAYRMRSGHGADPARLAAAAACAVLAAVATQVDALVALAAVAAVAAALIASERATGARGRPAPPGARSDRPGAAATSPRRASART
jgi:low temperature requirement protein LtrA